MKPLSEKFGALGNKGAKGETWLFERLSKRYQTSDYRKDAIMQSQGIDFGIKEPNWRREFTLDVKSNLYIEREYYAFKIELQRENKAGWFWNSRSDRIYHVNSYLGKYLYYDLNEMRYCVSKILLDKGRQALNLVEMDGDILLHITIKSNIEHSWPMSKLFSG